MVVEAVLLTMRTEEPKFREPLKPEEEIPVSQFQQACGIRVRRDYRARKIPRPLSNSSESTRFRLLDGNTLVRARMERNAGITPPEGQSNYLQGLQKRHSALSRIENA